MFPSEWKIDAYSHLLANADTLKHLERGDSAEEIKRSCNAKLNEFRRTCARVLLYE